MRDVRPHVAKTASKIDPDKVIKALSVKAGATVPQLMKLLKQPRINVARAVLRVAQSQKIKARGLKLVSVLADHEEGKAGARPVIHRLTKAPGKK